MIYTSFYFQKQLNKLKASKIFLSQCEKKSSFSLTLTLAKYTSSNQKTFQNTFQLEHLQHPPTSINYHNQQANRFTSVQENHQIISHSFQTCISMRCQCSSLKKVVSRDTNSFWSIDQSPLMSSKLNRSSTSSLDGYSPPTRLMSDFSTLGNYIRVNRWFLSWSNSENSFLSIAGMSSWEKGLSLLRKREERRSLPWKLIQQIYCVNLLLVLADQGRYIKLPGSAYVSKAYSLYQPVVGSRNRMQFYTSEIE